MKAKTTKQNKKPVDFLEWIFNTPDFHLTPLEDIPPFIDDKKKKVDKKLKK
jgi:hypothetical protein